MWRERKRLWCRLPLTFTVYSFDEERFFIKSGFLNQREDEVRLYRILDISITRTFMQRIFGLGTIHLHTSDKSLGSFEVKNITKVSEVKEELSEIIEIQRDKKRVSSREFISDNIEEDKF